MLTSNGSVNGGTKMREPAGALLVHVVRDDRLVLVLHQLDVHARFLLREHEPVAVVVVADVLVIQVRDRRGCSCVPFVLYQ